ncbi:MULTISPECIES: RNA-binding S4 domain-containing protein [unclassified Paracoccus (in: a-proteobacteria)]|uniref:RNA-binding S4 domain-containing protein n=1 Tax=unclassified Paracoccus (in: a-proteobacteria) TaxID=2688777 RepID=UPI00160397C4|nr:MULTISPECIES: RNA-binding S4 domain-containing protein [unclassified Paracoccus (in: a-proteobacteria)]MBB1490081.1 RNA-binding S4 domain-containing protein [Paracoccus sp. MC1854]MBB1496669.1 RNA-binding S4 domain-containing protein [Paracoccus sp. MC1862]QQO43682.1 RNA-binding S4 domain-containing protein [Paracoccus sp. MC1862]
MVRRGRDRDEDEDEPPTSIRLDRWLCHARVFKTRTMAADRISEGGVRVNGAPCRKPGHEVKAGDVVTAAAPGGVRSLRVLAPGERRGPASEARELYEDLDAAPGAAPEA